MSTALQTSYILLDNTAMQKAKSLHFMEDKPYALQIWFKYRKPQSKADKLLMGSRVPFSSPSPLTPCCTVPSSSSSLSQEWTEMPWTTAPGYEESSRTAAIDLTDVLPHSCSPSALSSSTSLPSLRSKRAHTGRWILLACASIQLDLLSYAWVGTQQLRRSHCAYGRQPSAKRQPREAAARPSGAAPRQPCEAVGCKGMNTGLAGRGTAPCHAPSVSPGSLVVCKLLGSYEDSCRHPIWKTDAAF